MNEKYLDRELAYVPKRDIYVGMAAIHLAFQPSDTLQQSLLQFVKPESHRHFNPILMSDEVTRLQYTGGDASGLRYMSVPTIGSPDSLPASEWLKNYKHDIDRVKSRTVPVATYGPHLERTESGAMYVELALLPGPVEKRKFGKKLLRHLRVVPSDNTFDDVIYVHTVIPKSQLAPDDALCDARLQLMARLGVDRLMYHGDDSNQSHAAPPSERMSVKPAFIAERIVSHRDMLTS